jgi:hypothetical protein
MAGRDVIALGRIINRDFLETSDHETLSIVTSSAPGGGAAQ